VPSPQQASLPVRWLWLAGIILPSFGGFGAVRFAGSGLHGPQVPSPQHDSAPVRLLLSADATFL